MLVEPLDFFSGARCTNFPAAFGECKNNTHTHTYTMIIRAGKRNVTKRKKRYYDEMKQKKNRDISLWTNEQCHTHRQTHAYRHKYTHTRARTHTQRSIRNEMKKLCETRHRRRTLWYACIFMNLFTAAQLDSWGKLKENEFEYPVVGSRQDVHIE